MGLHQFSRRAMWKRPGRTILTVLSIVIGVAAMVSVSVSTATTRNAYKEMFAAVTGRTGLAVEGEGQSSFSEELVSQIEPVPGVQAAIPVIQRDSVIYANEQRIRLKLLGVDPERDHLVRDYDIKAGRALTSGDELLLDESFARRLQVKVNDEVRLLAPKKRGVGLMPVKVVGILAPRGSTTLQQAGLVLLPLKTAQAMFVKKDEIDTIQIVLAEGADAATVQAQVAKLLPPGVTVHAPKANTMVMQQTMLPAEEGLRLSSMFTALLASFIILNTFMMNVGERRRQLSILRAIGATKRQIMGTVVRESLWLGSAGTVLGIGVGLVAAYLLNSMLAKVLDVELPAMVLTLQPFIVAALLGIAMSVTGAVVPALRAGRVSPLEGMDRVSRADLKQAPWFYVTIGFVLVAIGSGGVAISILGFVGTDIAVYSGMGLLVGLVLISPLVLVPFSTLVVWLLRPLLRVEGHLALRQVLRHRTRSSLTSGVLMVAACAGVAMACSILDNVGNVQRWYHKAIPGDFFLRATLPNMSDGLTADLPDEVREELLAHPLIRSVQGASWVSVNVGDQKAIVVGREFLANAPLPFDLVDGDESRLRDQLSEGQVLISTVLGQTLNLVRGDEVEVNTREGATKLHICGIVNDYIGGGMTIHMRRDHAVRLLHVEGYDALIVRAERKDLDRLRPQLQTIADKFGVLLHSYSDMTQVIDRMVLGIDGYLWGLVVLGFVVAAFGVVNTLTMSVLEQTRELGLLRIVAMTKRQVRRTILTQAFIIGIVGLVPGVLVGVLFAFAMNLAMYAALGHHIEFNFHPWLVIGTLFSALTITAIAAWIPAQRAARLDLVQALHYE